MNISLSPKKILIALLSIAVLQYLLYVVSYQYLESPYFTGGDGIRSFLMLFNMDIEASLPTWYSQSLFLVAALALAVTGFIAKHMKNKFSPYWFGLSFVFIYLSADDGAMIHERMDHIAQHFVTQEGVFYYSWWVPMMIIVALLAAVYFRFFLSLPNRLKLLFALAFTVFISGAVGLEMYAAYSFDTFGTHPSVFIVGLEELLEITGVSILIYAVLDYLKQTTPKKSLPRLGFK